jgi:putative ATP-dependent endonuclease of OLD family
MYKANNVICGKFDSSLLGGEQERKINRQVTNTRGEIFFSKAIVFVEGETEEQALHIFAENYFGASAVELGLDFVGVSGFRNYLTFIRFADTMGIPWFIFTDAENTPDKNVKASVEEQFVHSSTSKNQDDVLIFLDDGNDFEKQLISDGYQTEIKNVILNNFVYHNEQHRASTEDNNKIAVNARTDDQLYSSMTSAKTKFGPDVAHQIVIGVNPLPPKVITLFEKINSTLTLVEGDL